MKSDTINSPVAKYFKGLKDEVSQLKSHLKNELTNKK